MNSEEAKQNFSNEIEKLEKSFEVILNDTSAYEQIEAMKNLMHLAYRLSASARDYTANDQQKDYWNNVRNKIYDLR